MIMIRVECHHPNFDAHPRLCVSCKDIRYSSSTIISRIYCVLLLHTASDYCYVPGADSSSNALWKENGAMFSSSPPSAAEAESNTLMSIASERSIAG